MICINCKDYKLLTYFEEYIVSNSPLEASCFIDIFDSSITIATEDLLCPCCGHIISKEEHYIDDETDLYNQILQFFSNKIMDDIDSCEQCGQGADIQGMFPSIKSCYSDQEDNPLELFNKINTSSTLEDLLNDLFYEQADYWSPYYEDIINHIECPHCGNGSGIDYDEKINYGTFDLYTELYTHADIEQFNHEFYGDELKDINNQINEFAQNISIDELILLKDRYLSNKLFISENPIFLKLVHYISKLFSETKGYELSENRTIFRARTAPIGTILDKSELWEVPNIYASHGRYNDIGISILYCANNKEATKNEITLPLNHAYNIATITTHKSFLLFPINYIFNGDFQGLIDEAVPSSMSSIIFKKQYIISNIVSAICMKVGFDGIVYRSTKDKISINYALFCTYEKNEDINILRVDIN